ncbi:hypothetical protein LTS10_008387 [Elasticomyces elasticus]|nr:hypothetical protein LTS10_008387 [Elasticomyces elasticus]
MTGYQVTMKAYAGDPDGGSNLVDVSALTAPTIVVVDGQRIGLGDFYTATFDEELAYEAYRSRGSSSVGPENVTSVGLYDCTLVCRIKLLTESADGSLVKDLLDKFSDAQKPLTYEDLNLTRARINSSLNGHEVTWTLSQGFQDSVSSSSTIQLSLTFPLNLTSSDQIRSNISFRSPIERTYNLTGPPLDISIRHSEGRVDPDDSMNAYFWAEDTLFNTTWLYGTSVCQPTNVYHWGFSAGMLLTFTSASTLYGVLVVALHWFVHLYSQSDRYKQHINLYGDVLDVAEQLRLQLGDDVRTLPRDQLEALVKAKHGDIGLDTSELQMTRKEEARLRKRAAKANCRLLDGSPDIELVTIAERYWQSLDDH